MEHRPEVGMRGLRAGLGPYGAPIRSSHALPVSGVGGGGQRRAPPPGPGQGWGGRGGPAPGCAASPVPKRGRQCLGPSDAAAAGRCRGSSSCMRGCCGVPTPPLPPHFALLDSFGSLWVTLGHFSSARDRPSSGTAPSIPRAGGSVLAPGGGPRGGCAAPLSSAEHSGAIETSVPVPVPPQLCGRAELLPHPHHGALSLGAACPFRGALNGGTPEPPITPSSRWQRPQCLRCPHCCLPSAPPGALGSGRGSHRPHLGVRA